MSNEIKGLILKADLLCETGLHIGNREGGNPPRGLNAPVLQNPTLNIQSAFKPYISATTLKGKLRNIAEILYEKNANRLFKKDDENGMPKRRLWRHECDSIEAAKNCQVCFLFGSSSTSGNSPAEDARNKSFAGRLQFRNATIQNLVSSEIKSENTLKRLAHSANPRTNERVPQAAIFNFSVIYFVYPQEISEIDQNLSYFVACLRFLENNYLGGNGSRGYGKIRFQNIHFNYQKYDNLEIFHHSLLKQEK